MNAYDVIRGIAWKGSGFSVLSCVHGHTDTPVLQVEVTSITRTVFRTSGDTPNTAESTTALVVANCIFNTLQTTGWTKDQTGYNFRDDLPATVLSQGGHTYWIQYQFVPVTGAPFLGAVAQIECRAARPS